MAEQIINERYSDDFLNNEVKEFALYTIKTRATLGLMDGLRLGARKIIHGGLTKTFKGSKSSGYVKYTSLMGAAFDNEYDHGDASLKNTIEQFSSRHVLKLAPFKTDGQIPTLRDNSIDTAARYLSVGASDYLDLYSVDMDLLTYNFESEKWVEPKFFLPLLPMGLLYRTTSPGFGIGYNGFSYNLYDVVSAVQQSIITGTCIGLSEINLKPDVYGIDPDKIIYNASKDQWFNIGDYKIIGNSLHIIDLPYHINNIKAYTDYLDKLVTKGIILEYFDRSTDKINVECVFAHGRLQQQLAASKFKFFNQFKLIKKIPNNNYNFVDVNERIVSFDSPNEYLDYFVKRRLEFFEKRRMKLIKDLTQERNEKQHLMDFIQAVVDEKLIITRRSKSDILTDIRKMGLTEEGLKLSISRLDNDSIQKLKEEILEIDELLDFYKKTTPKDMYLSDLIDLMESKFRVDIINPNNTVTTMLSAYDDNGWSEFDTDDIAAKPTRKKRRTTASKSKSTKPIKI